MTGPKLGALGMCMVCKRILISDVYKLCLKCAAGLLEKPAGLLPPPAGPEASGGEEVGGLYCELGGEG